MNKLILSFAIVLMLFSCKQEKEQQQEIQQYSIEQFYKNVNVFGGSFSADENKLLVTSNETGIYNVYALPVDGSPMEQITESTEESLFANSYFPNDDRILFSADKGGDENSHVFLRNADGSVKDLTPYEGAQSSFAGWSRDKKSFFFISNKRDNRFLDLYEMEVEAIEQENPEAKLIYENNEGLDISGISNNKRYLALVKSITTSNSELYLFDREKNELKHISQHEGDATYDAQFFSLNDEYLYLLTNEGSEFTYLIRYQIESGVKEKVFETNWDIYYAYHSENEKFSVIGINEDAKTVVKVSELESGEEVQLPEIEGGSISSVNISDSEKLIRLTVSTSTSPNNIYIYNFETKELKKLTDTLNPEINPEDLVEGKVIRYKSYDGLEIPAIYYLPKQASADNKVPALVRVHGGPGGQSRLGYNALNQYLVNHGYAVLAVNNRGSGGYGKTFYKMDDQKHGDVDLKDCVEAKKFFEESEVIDMEKVGIMGGSYGGYMVMAALTFAPEEFAVGVNFFGVTNWLRTLKSIPPYWESFRDALYTEMGDPFSADSVRLYKISPLFHGKNITKPLMVLQGANDVRVLQVESDEIVEAAKANGVPVKYVVFDDEGHGFRKKENEINGYGQVKTFLDKHLKKISEKPVPN